MTDFSLVIVTYNSGAVIEKCVQSIRITDYLKDKIEIFVVDNNSKDTTREIVQKNFKEVKIIELHENFGYAYACNRGIEKSRGKIVILLNPDVILDKNFFKNVYDFMKSHYNIGGVVPKMTDKIGTLLTYPKIPTILNRIYKYSGLYGLLHHDEVLYHNIQGTKKPILINNLEGPVAIFSHSVFSKVGLLNENFFLTHELTELSLRLQRKGLKLFYLPSAKVVHLISRSAGVSQKDSSSFVHKAEMRFFRVTYGRFLCFFVKFLIIFLLLIKIIPLLILKEIIRSKSLFFQNRIRENVKLLRIFLSK